MRAHSFTAGGVSALLSWLLASGAIGAAAEPYAYVDPLIGTDRFKGYTRWNAEGEVFPGASAPFGMTHPTPQTTKRGYRYSDETVFGFSLVNHMSGWPSGSSGNVFLMPVPGGLDTDSLHPRLDHHREEARPGFYSLAFGEWNIGVAFAALPRSFMGRITYNDPAEQSLRLWDIDEISVVSDHEIRIYRSGESQFVDPALRPKGYYLVIRFDQPFSHRLEGDSRRSVTLSFGGSNNLDTTVEMQASVSRTGYEQALENGRAEMPVWDFGVVAEKAADLWREKLGRITVKGGDENDKTIFYTALYHAYLYPQVASDVDGDYPERGEEPLLDDGFVRYTNISTWDMGRTQLPLMALLEPRVYRDVIRSVLATYDKSGLVPNYAMSGNHTVNAIADGYFKGIRDFDTDLARRAIVDELLEPPYYEEGFAEYAELGFVPCELRNSVTKTLEYAFNDHCGALLAQALGAAETADRLSARIFNYRNVFNPGVRLMRSRDASGAWCDASGFSEGDAWGYSWYVPHNGRDLVNLMGGASAFCELLDRAFDEGYYIHDNQHLWHNPFMYAYAGRSWKTQQRTREILERWYLPTPGGIPGNDDLGSTSAWYLLAAMGFYPVNLGTPEYVLTSPLFDEIIIRPSDGRTWTIRAGDHAKERPYIQSVAVNGETWNKAYLTHDILLAGGEIAYELGERPNTHWAADENALPTSVTPGSPHYEIQAFAASSTTVRSGEPLELSIRIANSGARGMYHLVVQETEEVRLEDFVLVDRGETVEKGLLLRLYAPGTHELRLDGRTLPVEVVPIREVGVTTFDYRLVAATPLVRKGEPIEIRAEARNTGSYRGVAHPVINLNGEPFPQPEIALDPGEKRRVEYAVTPAGTGFYDVLLPGSSPLRSKVYDRPDGSLAAWYTFDRDEEGIVFDDSGFGNDGVVRGAVQYVDGVDSLGLFPNRQGYVELPTTPSLDVTGPTITMMAWYYPSDEDGRTSILTKGGEHMLKFNNRWVGKFCAGGWGRGSCEFRLPDDWNRSWRHFAGVCRGDSLCAYIDGELVSTHQASTDTIIANPFHWNIGRNEEIKSGYPNGVIDDVRVYKEALDQEHIRAIARKYEPS